MTAAKATKGSEATLISIIMPEKMTNTCNFSNVVHSLVVKRQLLLLT